MWMKAEFRLDEIVHHSECCLVHLLVVVLLPWVTKKNHYLSSSRFAGGVWRRVERALVLVFFAFRGCPSSCWSVHAVVVVPSKNSTQALVLFVLHLLIRRLRPIGPRLLAQKRLDEQL
jgi:hypothetical protein